MNANARKQKAAVMLLEHRSRLAAACAAWGGQDAAGPFEEIEAMLMDECEK